MVKDLHCLSPTAEWARKRHAKGQLLNYLSYAGEWSNIQQLPRFSPFLLPQKACLCQLQREHSWIQREKVEKKKIYMDLLWSIMSGGLAVRFPLKYSYHNQIPQTLLNIHNLCSEPKWKYGSLFLKLSYKKIKDLKCTKIIMSPNNLGMPRW